MLVIASLYKKNKKGPPHLVRGGLSPLHRPDGFAGASQKSRLPKSSEWRNPLLSRINGSAQERLFLGKQVRFRRSYLEIVSGCIVITVCRIH